MKKVKVYITLKPEVLDPQGKVIMNTLHTLGYEDISDVRASKFFEVKINSDDENHIKKEIDEICDKVLANPNIETYRYEVE
ncbi:MAG: phosphoribosylformylglycinamidine synthase subunit PurS [Candidatus Cloacimonetes bacterium]|nr:phosphoribosylformylglycinamidine synthase subunit PurS [Candidatus Cloacimonadota bacterium]MBL7086814.1 phosphoribosylformylglycinamidine synthase subunit PurS [Candidatus Cloacimonadota bacterium]